MPKMRTNGIDLYYEVHGDGEPVALLNGIMQNTAAWAYQTPVFSKKYKVLLHDFRGQGKSDKPNSDYTWDLHVDDFRCLLDGLGIDKIHLVGISYGAENAMHFALKYPERVKSLVLGTAMSELEPLTRAWFDSWAAASSLKSGAKFFKLFSPSIYGNTFYKNNLAWLEERSALFDQTVTDEWFDSFDRLLKNLVTLNITDQLHRITAPTLILAGEQDVLKPLYTSQRIRAQIPHSELLIIADCGHVMTFEKPQEFNTAVLGFLQKIE